MIPRAYGRLFALCSCALLQACSYTWTLESRDVTKGGPPPITPVAIGKHVRALAVSADGQGMAIHVEPSDAVVRAQARARCTRPDAQPGPWVPARVTPPDKDWTLTNVEFYALDCEAAAGRTPARLEVEFWACVRGDCEVLRFDYSASDARSLSEWARE